MSKDKIIYTCSNCDAQYPKWQGRCSTCGKWGTIDDQGEVFNDFDLSGVEAMKLTDFTADIKHQSTNIKEVDRVLGGGLVEGSVTLLSGEPGIGKSTLVLQLASNFAGQVLYVSGEEAVEQVGARLKRLGLNSGNISFLNDARIEALVSVVAKEQPQLLIVDSVQTIVSSDVGATAGSVGQIKTVTSKLVELAKNHRLIVILIGHVTKGGVAAGPKTLEHLVDVVLDFAGEKSSSLRLLRASKNRFGTAEEVGIFQMTEQGLEEVSNPAGIFLSNRHHGPGSCLTAVTQGSRSFLIEVQALVSRSRFGQPRRTAAGFDYNRLQLLLAVLSEKAGIKLAYSDVYINLVGGIKSREPSLDLAVCLALASAFKQKSPRADLVVLGEVGLGGEIRPGINTAKILQEAVSLGINFAIIPSGSEVKKKLSLEIMEVKNITEVIKWLDNEV